MKQFILFSGTDCHLCDLAKQLLSNVETQQCELTEINVKQERQHFHQYGARIPVLRNAQSGDELGWPFDEQQLAQFMNL